MPNNAQTKPYGLVSADQHVNEPPDLWTRRVPAKFKDRALHVKSLEQGDAYILEGAPGPISFGMNMSAGLAPDQVKHWLRWDQVRKGGYIGKERVKEMEVDGVDAALLFPTPRLTWGICANKDREWQLAMVRAYNEWLAEYCSDAPDRLFGVPLLPATGVKDAIDEFHRWHGTPGMVGPHICNYPHGTAQLSAEDDALWAALVEAKTPLTIHIKVVDQPHNNKPKKIVGATRNNDAENIMQEFMMEGVLDRFPELKVVFAEVDCGWVPFFKEQADNRFHRMSRASNYSVKLTPSQYVEKHFFFAFVTDAYALRNRDAVGVENMLWSDDYPHMGGDWPYTQRALSNYMAGIAKDERELILSGNATRLYNLPGLAA